jgi:hypothetical protein
MKRPKDPAGWWDPSAADRYANPATAARKGRFGPDEVGPDYVQNVVADARRAGKLPESWVADSRAPESVAAWSRDETAEDVAEWVIERIRGAHVRIGRQVGQDGYIELWCEAGDLIPRLSRVAADYDVPVSSGGGMDGLKGKRAAAERIAARASRDVATVVLLVGDHDLHGVLIRDVYEADVGAWVTGAHGVDRSIVTFETIAVTEDQARQHDLLDADGKAEADGLPVQVMDQILRDAIERHSDPGTARGGRERPPGRSAPAGH